MEINLKARALLILTRSSQRTRVFEQWPARTMGVTAKSPAQASKCSYS